MSYLIAEPTTTVLSTTPPQPPSPCEEGMEDFQEVQSVSDGDSEGLTSSEDCEVDMEDEGMDYFVKEIPLSELSQVSALKLSIYIFLNSYISKYSIC